MTSWSTLPEDIIQEIGVGTASSSDVLEPARAALARLSPSVETLDRDTSYRQVDNDSTARIGEVKADTALWAAAHRLKTLASPATTSAVVPDERVIGMEKWEGRVVEIDGDLFTAELVSLDSNSAIVFADFDLDVLTPSDREGLSVGDTFYLTVRTISDKGLRTRTSSVRLRRLGAWAEQDLIRARADAEELRRSVESFFE